MDKIITGLGIIIIVGLSILQGWNFWLDIEQKQRNLPVQEVITVYDTVQVIVRDHSVEVVNNDDGSELTRGRITMIMMGLIGLFILILDMERSQQLLSGRQAMGLLIASSFFLLLPLIV